MKYLLFLFLLISPLFAEITVIRDYNFNTEKDRKKVRTQSGTFPANQDKLVFDGSTYGRVFSGVTQADNFGMEVITSFDTYKQFGVIGVLTDMSKENKGLAITLSPHPQTFKSHDNSVEKYDLYGLISGQGYFGATKVVDHEPDEKIHLAIVVENGLCSFYVNGVKQTKTSRRPITGPLIFLYLGAHPFDAPNESVFLGSIYRVRTFKFEPSRFEPKDLLTLKK